MSLLLTFITSLMLGMRHATDPDHIVAVTTIVTRERSVVKAAGIGAVWGIGHTITLLVVGGAIIAFKVAVNARLGLSMELCVAVMLIVLGVLNLFDVRTTSNGPKASRPFFVGVVHGLAGSAAAALLIVPFRRYYFAREKERLIVELFFREEKDRICVRHRNLEVAVTIARRGSEFCCAFHRCYELGVLGAESVHRFDAVSRPADRIERVE